MINPPQDTQTTKIQMAPPQTNRPTPPPYTPNQPITHRPIPKIPCGHCKVCTSKKDWYYIRFGLALKVFTLLVLQLSWSNYSRAECPEESSTTSIHNGTVVGIRHPHIDNGNGQTTKSEDGPDGICSTVEAYLILGIILCFMTQAGALFLFGWGWGETMFCDLGPYLLGAATLSLFFMLFIDLLQQRADVVIMSILWLIFFGLLLGIYMNRASDLKPCENSVGRNDGEESSQPLLYEV